MGSIHYFNFNPLKSIVIVVVVVVTGISLCCADDGFIYSRATFYGSPECSGNPSGACGFGEYGSTVNDGLVTGVSRLYRNGSGCGACYQVRCKIPAHCREEGTTVVVTDFGVGGGTDFVMNARAYASMARPNMAAALFSFGVVAVDFRRIPCRYKGYNLMIKVHERSYFPSYLAIVAIYQAGMYDITDAQIWQEDCKEWRGMRRVYGAVWDMENPSVGSAVNLRLQVSGEASGEVKWVQVANVIPSNWKAGVAYDAAIQLD